MGKDHISRLACTGVSKLGHHWFRWWLVACSVPSYYLNHYWLILNWALGNNVIAIWNNIQFFSLKKMHLKCCLLDIVHFSGLQRVKPSVWEVKTIVTSKRVPFVGFYKWCAIIHHKREGISSSLAMLSSTVIVASWCRNDTPESTY